MNELEDMPLHTVLGIIFMPFVLIFLILAAFYKLGSFIRSVFTDAEKEMDYYEL
jgi:Na+-transporting methylmalonyl-CoA/oxaloacetate decarboxylase gamma subunit